MLVLVDHTPVCTPVCLAGCDTFAFMSFTVVGGSYFFSCVFGRRFPLNVRHSILENNYALRGRTTCTGYHPLAPLSEKKSRKKAFFSFRPGPTFCWQQEMYSVPSGRLR